MSPRLDSLPSAPGTAGDRVSGMAPLTVGSAVLCTLGAAGAAVGAGTGVDALAGGGLAAAAVGLAGVVYGVCRPETPVESAITVGGVAAAVLSTLGAAVVGPATGGGFWLTTYVAGLAFALVGGVLLPVRSRPETWLAFGDWNVDGDAAAGGGAGTGRRTDAPVVGIEPTDEEEWTWRITSSGGPVLASAPRTYDSASDAERAAHRLVDALDGEYFETTTSGGVERSGSDRTGDDDDATRSRRSIRRSGDLTDALTGDDAGDDDSGSDPPGRASGVVDAEAVESAVFVVEPEEDGWRWRLRYEGETVVGESPGTYSTRAGARSAIERVRSEAPDAGVLTYDPGAFEVFRDESGRWTWQLRREESVVAVATSDYDSRADAMTVVEGVLDAVEDGPDFEREDGGVRWVLAVEDQPVATAPAPAADESTALASFERVRECVDGAGAFVLDPAGFAVEPAPGGTWNWSLRRRDGTTIARGPGHTNRDRTIEGVRTVQRVAPHADVEVDDDTARMIEEALSDAAEARSMAERIGRLGDDDEDGDDETAVGSDPPGTEETGVPQDGGEKPGEDRTGDEVTDGDTDEGRRSDGETGTDDDGTLRIEVHSSGGSAPRRASTRDPGESTTDDSGGWGWHLVDETGVVAAVDGFPTRESAVADADDVADGLSGATVVSVDPVVVEVYHDDGWHWRLVADDGVLAAATESFDRARDAGRSADRATTALDAGTGDVEVYRGEGWGWRYRTPEGVVAAGRSDFETPNDAREAARRLDSVPEDLPVVECSTPTVEVYSTGENWTWRLRSARGSVPVDGAVEFEDAATAEGHVEAIVDGLAAAESPVVDDEPPGDSDR